MAVSWRDFPCDEWSGRTTRDGYGIIPEADRHGEMYAHRAAWIEVHGPIPAGLLVCHHCDNPPCREPEHLFLGTHQDNALDRERKGRHGTGGGRLPIKLREGDVRLIRELVASGEPKKAVARRFAVDPALVRGIVARRLWKSVA